MRNEFFNASILSVMLLAGSSQSEAVTITASPVTFIAPMTITYIDLDSDGLFELNEMTAFSGYANGGGSAFATWRELIGIPTIPGVMAASSFGTLPDTCVDMLCLKNEHVETVGGPFDYPDAIPAADWQSRVWSVDGTQVYPAPVPEPGTLAYAVFGCLALAAKSVVKRAGSMFFRNAPI